ncbi:MAG: ABC transporter ATP-binding protein [Euryarchaeota archaeon]|nr:ABC transporter ATP-binding protein [Euryarchaeota archaeon]
MNLLDIKNLNVLYGNLQVLWDISLTVREGEIVTIIGSNGAGKSTLVETIFGLTKPSSGKIEFNGENLLRIRTNNIVQKGLALVPEKREIFSKMTVHDNLALGGYMTGEDQENFDFIFEMFPVLHERTEQLAGTLSGGEQQMLAIGRSLMSKPKMLVLDEPSLGLSPLLVSSVLETIKKLNEKGLTVLLVEQNVFHALEISDRGYVIENGKIIIEGNSADLLHNEEIKTAYLGI